MFTLTITGPLATEKATNIHNKIIFNHVFKFGSKYFLFFTAQRLICMMFFLDFSEENT